MLSKALKNLLTPKAEKIETTQDLRTKCLDKDICALLLKGAKTSPNYVKSAMEKLLVEYPKVAFAAVDTSVLYVMGLEAEYLPEFQPGVPRFAVFQKVAGTADKSKTTGGDSSRLKTSVVTLDNNNSNVGYGPMSNLIASVIQKTASMQKVTSLPTIKTRTKKLEEEERQKRARRQDQQQRKTSSSSHANAGDNTGGGGYFSNDDNDGSRDGRRAERERRRAEHRANNPNFKAKTPEEIAEMERLRRQRMEEEAQKWNVAPDEDVGGAPDDGETLEEDWDDEAQRDDDAAAAAGEGSSSGGNEEDDEDVMDLD
jgi:hypothetical protein